MTRELINGVPADQYGLWCRHGHRLLVPDPTDTSDYPTCVPAEPWPCASCSLAELQAEMDAEATRWEAERWSDYWAMVREGMGSS